MKIAVTTVLLCISTIFLSFSQSSNNSHHPSSNLTKEELISITNRKLQIVDSINNSQQLKAGTSNPSILVTGPEQDCKGAISVCQQTYTQPNSYSGYGTIQEVYNTCLLVKERQSVWYVFTVQTTGSFGFILNTSKDYDFALYDITTIGCGGIPSATPVRCNFSGTYGNTGLNASSTQNKTPAISYNYLQSPIMPGITNVNAGETYALIIDNFTQDNNGYTLTFNGTASIFDNTAPVLISANDNCNNKAVVTFSEPIKCSSIASNGNDFNITGPGPITITAAAGVNCSSNGLTNQVEITYTGTTTSGVYTVAPKVTNSITDKCGAVLSTTPTANFNLLTLPISITASKDSVCGGQTSNLNITGAPSSEEHFHGLLLEA
jgi:hypothetical protein